VKKSEKLVKVMILRLVFPKNVLIPWFTFYKLQRAVRGLVLTVAPVLPEENCRVTP
jgi:hypothetical protein